MSWFTPERRLFVYRITTSLLAVAVALGVFTQGTADQVMMTVQQVLNAVTAVSALLSTVLAAKNVPTK
jgi:hypothetical protein